MAKGIRLGAGGVRNCKKVWVGAGGVKKVKKIFAGIGGVVKLLFSSGVSYAGDATPLVYSRYLLASTQVGDYAIFAGGVLTSYAVYDVEAYSSSLVKATASSMSYARHDFMGITVGGYAVFREGGAVGNDFYNSSLVRTTSSTAGINRMGSAATNAGTYGIFVGGVSGTVNPRTIISVSPSLVVSEMGGTFNGGQNPTATTINDHAVFAGGLTLNDVTNKRVYSFSPSLISQLLADMTQPRWRFSSVTVNGHALFIGGLTDGVYGETNTIDIYNSSLVKLTPISLERTRSKHTSWLLGDYAVVAGGFYQGGRDRVGETIEYFDSNLVRTVLDERIAVGEYPSACNVGKYGLLAGGSGSDDSGFSVKFDAVRIFEG